MANQERLWKDAKKLLESPETTTVQFTIQAWKEAPGYSARPQLFSLRTVSRGQLWSCNKSFMDTLAKVAQLNSDIVLCCSMASLSGWL